MKKTLIVALMVVAMVFGIAGVAYAGNTEGTFDLSTYPLTDPTIHSGYATSTNACKACHDVHGNTNYKLFIQNTVTAGCMYCHVAGAPVAGKTVYTAAAVHRTATVTTIPDGSVDTPLALFGAANELDCQDCHNAAPHGKGYVAGNYALSSDSGEIAFCTRCHDANNGTLSAGVRVSNSTHVMGTVGDVYTEFGAATLTHADALATSALCTNCHVDATDFPHSGNFKLLKTGAAVSALDTVCLDCHSAVGTAY